MDSISGNYGVGIDIGSTCAKTVVIDPDREVIWRDLRPTGWSSVETAEAIRMVLHDKVKTDGQARIRCCIES